MKIRDITLGAMLLAIALTVFVIENQIPLPVPIPGFKIGLSNIITLITLYLWDKKHTFVVLMLRIIIGSVVCGSGLTALYSFAGGIACFGVMSVLHRLPVGESIPAVSMIGALAHNLAQLCVAAFILNSSSVFAYFPLLCAVGLASGLFTGLMAKLCIRSKAVSGLFGGGISND